MRILILSDNETFGGAGIAVSRLANGLCAGGHTVLRAVGRPDWGRHDWETQIIGISPAGVGHRLARRALPEPWKTRWTSTWERRRTAESLRNIIRGFAPQVINVHNLHNAGWPPALVEECLAAAPTVWTLHDMWSFTGRCAYNSGCRQFERGCDASCPTPEEYPSLAPSLIGGAWESRRELFGRYPQLTAVTPSHWLKREAETGLWKGHRVEVIPNGLPLETYRPVARAMAREALGIETHGPVVLAGADNLNDRRKGGKLLSEALAGLKRADTTLVTFGAEPERGNRAGSTIHLGRIDFERAKVLAYNAADLFAQCAVEDNLPNTVMEAVACGTPVAGFAIGGVPEMVRPGQTGWLASQVSAGALAECLEDAIRQIEEGATLRDSCRRVAELEYGQSTQAARYTDLFGSLLGRADGIAPEKAAAAKVLTH
jgi:glycosyltransferase involved in cell wall biosynthesis